MKIKVRMIGSKMDSSNILVSNKALQLGTTIYIEKFPEIRDVGILTVIEGVIESENLFQIAVKDSTGKLLGRGNKFRAKIISQETNEAIVIYNINQAAFSNKDDFYIIELWNNENIIDTFELKAKNNIYNIYKNIDERGTISFI